MSRSPNHGSGPHRDQLRRLKEVQLRQLQFRRRTLGEAHPGTLQSMDTLAETLSALGELERARTLVEDALHVREESLGRQHPAVTETAWTLFHTLDRLDERAALRAVHARHLAWLAGSDPSQLEDSQRRIRDWIVLIPKGRFGDPANA